MINILKTKIDLNNTKLSDITGVEHLIHAEICINIDEITAVRQHAEDDEEHINPDLSFVYLKSGEYFMIYTPYTEVLQQLGWV